MALLTKTVLICNKCGREYVDSKSNVNILGEPFFLCGKCLERLMDFMEEKPGGGEPEPKDKVRSFNTQWDDDMITKLFDLRMEGKSLAQIAKELALSRASVDNIVFRIRHAKPGSNLHQYYRKYFEIGGDEE